jgi:ribosomal protein L37E
MLIENHMLILPRCHRCGVELYHEADYCDNCSDEGYKERPDYEPDRED